MVAKFFNTSGPCSRDKHYMIGIAERFADTRADFQRLIEEERFFIFHAPRQTGKTTMVMHLAEDLTRSGRVVALYVNIESGQALRDDVAGCNAAILSAFKLHAKAILPEDMQPEPECFDVLSMNQGMSEFLSAWCAQLDKPLVLFLDEVDSLIGDSLLSVLRQLRAGYNLRPKGFPSSVCLIGLRDIRDYRIYSKQGGKYLIGGSAFNIKETSIRLGDFSLDQIERLYGQHTVATGQVFEQTALEEVFRLTRGQPWLVNALGRELCFGTTPVAGKQTVTRDHVRNAAEILIRRRDVHLDQLADKLTEPRVARVIESILIGEDRADDLISSDDRQYVMDLGLVIQGERGWEIANPIYREIVPRELTTVFEDQIAQKPAWYIKPDGRLDMEKLIAAMVDFYRNNHAMITKRKRYNEAAHHLVFLAWLHRVVNSGGQIEREYAVGSRRMDLHIRYGDEHFVIELKLYKSGALEEGKEQLVAYLRTLGLEHGYLVLFLRREADPEAIGMREEIEHQGKRISILYF